MIFLWSITIVLVFTFYYYGENIPGYLHVTAVFTYDYISPHCLPLTTPVYICVNDRLGLYFYSKAFKVGYGSIASTTSRASLQRHISARVQEESGCISIMNQVIN